MATKFVSGFVGSGPRSRTILFVCLLGLISLGLCSCATPYHPLKRGTGYSSSQVASNEFAVSFKGNADTTYQRAYDFALLRSAEVTLQNGFRFFSVVDVTNASSAKRYTEIYRTYGTPVLGEYDFGRLDYLPGPPVVEVQQPQIFYTPGTVLLIECFPAKPEKKFAYDAAMLAESLKRKYRIS